MFPQGDVVTGRAFVRKFLNPLVVIATGVLLAFFWFRSLAIEPFDFDESVYRQMAEEMKKAGTWLSQPIFNGEPYNHKPPTYIAVLAGFSAIADGLSPQVTSFSSRTVSIFFSVALAFLLHRTWKILCGQVKEKNFEFRKINDFSMSPVFFLLMTFLPTVASSAVLLDPMLVFCTSLYFCSQVLLIGKDSLRVWQKRSLLLMSVVGMTAATATKGLIGLVLPAGAAFIYCALVHRLKWSEGAAVYLSSVVRTGLLRFFPAWLAAAFLAFLFYSAIWSTGGSGFVEEFFIKHHFGRATSAMEGHSGPVFYYLPIMLLGGGYAFSWLGFSYLVAAQKENVESLDGHECEAQEAWHRVELWLLSWCVFSVFFFSLLATKLPNYIWPVWPALALWCCVASRRRSFNSHPVAVLTLRVMSRWIPFLLPGILLTASVLLLMWEPVLSGWITLKERESAVLTSALGHKEALSIAFGSAGALLLLGAFLLRWWGELCIRRQSMSPLLAFGTSRWLAFLQVAACTALMIFAIPAAEEVMTLTVQQATAKAKMALGVNEPLATSDLYSPNVVSSHGEQVYFAFGENDWVFNDKRFNVILTPVWNIGLCQRHGYDIAQGAEYLRVCLRSYKRTLEGPGR